MRRKIFPMMVALILLSQVVFAKVPKPEEVLKFKVGEARKVADMHQIVTYFKKLDSASDRIEVREVGKTTLENPFIVAVVTSPENQKNLERYRRYQQLLADPRKISDKEAQKIILEGKAIVMINCSIHASEIGASQMSMELAYHLATRNDKKTREILDNVILLLVPMHNPDGIQMVVDWYKKNLGTKFEGCRMPWLYHKYVGHDNNRDWYMFTQVESRLTLKIHDAWHPHIIVDMHQMGSRGARIFVPPFIDPYEPNIDPILRQEVAMMGTFIATEMTAERKAGVIHSDRYDAWTPARAYHHYHGGIRILTEVASVKLATPITVKYDELRPEVKKPSVKMPLLWKGGKWTLRDIVNYDYSAAMAALTNAAKLREIWVKNFYLIQKKAVSRINSPYAFLLPFDQRDISTAVKLLNVLQMGGVEIRRAQESFVADESQYSEGTFIIYTAQPYGGFAKALLEKQVYPEIREYPGAPLKTPYDVVAHTLPLLMGVEVIQVEKPFKVNSVLLSKIDKPKGKFQTTDGAVGYAWGHETNDDFVALNRLVQKGYKVFWSVENFRLSDKMYPPGTMIVTQKEGLKKDLESIVEDLYIHFEGLKSNPGINVYGLKPVKLGLYKSWTASMDEGWTRWVLEQYDFPYKNIYNKDLRGGNLNKEFDVIIFPDMRENIIVNGIQEGTVPPEYCGGIGEVGVKHIKEFIKKGGTLITINSASDFPMKQFYLSIENSVADVDRKSFFVPGSILKVLNDNNHPIAYGYEEDGAVFFRRSPVFAVRKGRSVVRYPIHNPLLSGWVNGEEYLHNKSAIVDIPYGEGKIILIGFPVLYRGQSHSTFRYLFNAIYYGAASPAAL
ncbi:MAG: M14 metallopeptidase family protein [Candidatus Aminicenantaceae bacterium]